MGILIIFLGLTKSERGAVYNLVKSNRIFKSNA